MAPICIFLQTLVPTHTLQQPCPDWLYRELRQKVVHRIVDTFQAKPVSQFSFPVTYWKSTPTKWRIHWVRDWRGSNEWTQSKFAGSVDWTQPWTLGVPWTCEPRRWYMLQSARYFLVLQQAYEISYTNHWWKSRSKAWLIARLNWRGIQQFTNVRYRSSCST